MTPTARKIGLTALLALLAVGGVGLTWSIVHLWRRPPDISQVGGTVLEREVVITVTSHSALYDRPATINGAGAVPLATVCPLGSPSRTHTVYRPGGNAAPARHSQYTVSGRPGCNVKLPCVAVGAGPPARGRSSRVTV